MAGSVSVIGIGASTGGIYAVPKVLTRFSAMSPPVVLVVHLRPGMSRIYADQLDDELNISVSEAETGTVLERGHMYIAPAEKHMKLITRGGRLVVERFAGPRIHQVIPAVDVLFESIAKEVKKDAVGVLLTGIGEDGARGLLAMRNAGAQTIGQDEKTSVVYGMPKVAMNIGAVMHQLPIDAIGNKIISLI